ncbi:MAG: hypothetical protein D6812_17860, partial [Deltaproteobacteria bacterium]
EELLEVDDHHLPTYHELARLYLALERIPEAISQFMVLSRLYIAAGRIKEGLDALSRMVELNPEDFENRMKLAERFLAAGYREEAETHFIRAAETLSARGHGEAAQRKLELLFERGLQSRRLVMALARQYWENQQFRRILLFAQEVPPEIREYPDFQAILAQTYGMLAEESLIPSPPSSEAKSDGEMTDATRPREEVSSEVSSQETMIPPPADMPSEGPPVPLAVFETDERGEPTPPERLPVDHEKILDRWVSLIARKWNTKENYPKAIDFLERATRRFPAHRRMQELLEEYYVRTHRLREAVAQLHKLANLAEQEGDRPAVRSYLVSALSLDPRHPMTVRRLKENYLAAGDREAASSLLVRAGKAAIRKRAWSFAYECFGEVLTLDPGNLEALEIRFELARKLQLPQEAIEHLFELAELSLASGQRDRAIRYFERILEIDPEHVATLLKLGDIHVAQGQRIAALPYLKKLAEVSLRGKNLERARDALYEVLRWAPEDEAAYRSLKGILLEMGSRQDACRELLKHCDDLFARESPPIALAEQRLREILEILPDFDEARQRLAHLHEYERADERKLERRFREAEAAKQRRDYPLALSILEEIARRDPDNERALRQIAILSKEIGDQRRTTEALKRLVRMALDRKNYTAARNDAHELLAYRLDTSEALEVCEWLTQSLVGLGLREEARRELERLCLTAFQLRKYDMARDAANSLLSIVPGHPDALYTLSQLAAMNGEIEEARELLWSAARHKASAGQPATACQWVQPLVSDPACALEIRKDLARWLGASGNAPAALEQIEWLITHDPEKIEAYLDLALSIDPANEAILLRQKEHFLGKGDRTAAGDVLTELIRIRLAVQDVAGARDALLELLQVQPSLLGEAVDLFYREGGRPVEQMQVIQTLGEDLLARGEDATATLLFERFTRLAPELLHPREKLKEIYLKQELPKKAVATLWEWVEEYGDLEDPAMEEILQEILAIDPANEEVRLMLKDFYLIHEMPQEAIEELQLHAVFAMKGGKSPEPFFREILAIDPGYAQGYEYLLKYYLEHDQEEEAITLLFQWADHAGTHGDLDTAIRALERITALDPTNWTATERLCDRWIEAEEFEKARQKMLDFAESTRQDEDPERHERIQRCLTRIENAKIAHASRMAAESEPGMLSDDETREQTELPVVSDRVRALNDIYEMLDALEPQKPEGVSGVPVVESPEAERSGGGKASLDPWKEEGARSANRLAGLEAFTIDWDEVEEHAPWNEPVGEPPASGGEEDLGFMVEEAKYYEKLGYTEIAASIYRDILRITPRNADARAGLERIEAADHAMERLERSLDRITDDSIEKQYLLGVAYREMDLIERAIEQFQKVLSSDPGKRKWDCYRMLGGCFSEQGRMDKAIESYTRALEDPDLPHTQRLETLFLLGQLHLSLQEKELALERFEAIDAIEENYRGVRELIARIKPTSH